MFAHDIGTPPGRIFDGLHWQLGHVAPTKCIIGHSYSVGGGVATWRCPSIGRRFVF